ncbi:hypothetical protein BVRB_2g034120 [Beta vulgaris subsp. vulgaris]|nr:hypothetical protein BVRB_2g034120 [Beta vulgaris subsp. vulgaris]
MYLDDFPPGKAARYGDWSSCGVHAGHFKCHIGRLCWTCTVADFVHLSVSIWSL